MYILESTIHFISDLPLLSFFTAGEFAFYHIKNICLSSIITVFILTLIDVPFGLGSFHSSSNSFYSIDNANMYSDNGLLVDSKKLKDYFIAKSFYV